MTWLGIRFRKFRGGVANQTDIRNLLEVALRKHVSVFINYTDENGADTKRVICPLYIDKYTNVRAYDTLREDYRSFIISRILSAKLLTDDSRFNPRQFKKPEVNANYREVV
jgi:predicted DNA-binding transcriptional regulator YafY